MKRFLKILGIIVGVIVLLVVALGLYLAVFFDPNDYTERIAGAVHGATGRTVAIEGDLRLSVFPWLGVEFGAVRMGNPVGFTAPGVSAEDDFLRLKGGKGYMALLPLLSGNVEISEIVIDGLTCALVRTAQGTANWDFSKPGGAPAPQVPAPAPAPVPVPDDAAGDPLQMLKTFGLRNFSVLNATITLDDAQEKMRALVENLSLELKELDVKPGSGNIGVALGGADLRAALMQYVAGQNGLDVTVRNISASMKDFAPGKKSRAAVSAAVDAAQPDIAAEVKLSLDADETSADMCRFRDVNLEITPKRGLVSPEFGAITLRGNLDIAPKTLDIAFNPLNIASQHGSLAATGAVSGGTPSISGSFTISAAPAALLKALGLTVATQDSNALKKLEARFALKASPTSLNLSDLVVQLDDTNIQGAASAVLDDAIRADVQLAVDSLNLDRYLPPAGANSGTASMGMQGGGQAGGPTGGAAKPANTADIKKTLNRLSGQAKLTVGTLVVSKVPLTNILIEALADRGMITVNPADLTVAGGQVAATLKADARQAATRSDVTVKVSNVDIGELQRLAMGKEYVASRATADIALNAAGDSAEAIKRTVGGRGSLALSKGTLTGITLVPQQVPGIPDDGMAKTGQVFDGMTATFTGTNGVFANKDMKFLSPLCDIAGAGTADLPKNVLDYRLTLSFAKIMHLPARLYGPLNAPEYSIDPSGLGTGVLDDAGKLLQGGNPQDVLRNLLPSVRQGGGSGGSAPDSGTGQGSGGSAPASPNPRGVLRDILR